MAKAKKRDYENDFPSVTQVLDVLRKPGLEMWYRVNTPQFINEAMSKGRGIGTSTHEAIENYINTGSLEVNTEWPDEVSMALRSFALFRSEHPEFQLKASETKMTSIIQQYNGTMDIMAEINRELHVGDWKTTAAKDNDKPEIYDEAYTQTSAYRALYNECFNAQIDKAFIVSLAKDKVAYSLAFIDKQEMDERYTKVFLAALAIKKFQQRNKKEKKDAV